MSPGGNNRTWQSKDAPYDVSPDGSQVVFVHEASRDRVAGVYLLDTRASPPHWRFLLPLDFTFREVRLSPDGSKLSLTRAPLDVYVRDISTGSEEQLTSTGNANLASWDPTSRYLVYQTPIGKSPGSSEPDSLFGVHVFDLAAKSSRALTHDGSPLYGGSCRFAPDGSAVVFALGIRMGTSRDASSYGHICRVNVDGTQFLDLTPADRTNNDFPVWLPDGRILFKAYEVGTFARHHTDVINADGTDRRRWPFDLDFPFGVVSSDGHYRVYTDADSSGQYGVLYRQALDDFTGITRQQLTTYIAPDSLEAVSAVQLDAVAAVW
jgi:Tol biopolymer transport system component